MTYVNTTPKFQTNPLSPEKQALMEMSLKQCEGKEFKPVRCPHCSRIVGYAPKDEDNLNYYICHKCKAQMYLNSRYFKTSHRHINRRIYLRRKYGIE